MTVYKTLEATIDTQGKIHWQEQPPIQGQCRVLITLLDELKQSNNNNQLIEREDFLQFLLGSPEMSDTEYQAIQEKKQHLNQLP